MKVKIYSEENELKLVTVPRIYTYIASYCNHKINTDNIDFMFFS